jgi:hypothetical protein
MTQAKEAPPRKTAEETKTEAVRKALAVLPQTISALFLREVRDTRETEAKDLKT